MASQLMHVVPQDQVRFLVLGNEDGLTDDDLRYIRRRIRKLSRNLNRKYQFLGRALGDESSYRTEPHLNMESRTFALKFMRCVDGVWKPEAIIDTDVSLLKPPTRKQQLKLVGAPIPNTVRERVVSMTGSVSRPGVDNKLSINDFRISKVPAISAQIFETLMDNGFLYHPRKTNYIPFLDGEDLAPLGRAERACVPKMPVHALTQSQREYAQGQFKAFRENFERNHGHVFDHIRFDVDPVAKTFNLTFKVNQAFRAKGSPEIRLQGDFDIFWRNKGNEGSGCELRIKGGLSRTFHQSALLTDPIKIHGKNRTPAAESLFNIIAMSGRLSVHDAEASAERRDENRLLRPGPRERVKDRRTDRYTGKRATLRLACES